MNCSDALLFVIFQKAMIMCTPSTVKRSQVTKYSHLTRARTVVEEPSAVELFEAQAAIRFSSNSSSCRRRPNKLDAAVGNVSHDYASEVALALRNALKIPIRHKLGRAY